MMYEPEEARAGALLFSATTSRPVTFAADCRRCPRLDAHLEAVRQHHPSYHARPVPAFGAGDSRLLIVGLAPGLHGANATGRPFTGDQAGELLFRTLHRFGFSSQAESRAADDGLRLHDCRITNAVKCLPPRNHPNAAEIVNCNRYLAAEIETLPADGLILALGGIAHRAVVMACGGAQACHRFRHGALHPLPSGQQLLDSYHCSRYNLQTRRLTPEMFDAVFERARALL